MIHSYLWLLSVVVAILLASVLSAIVSEKRSAIFIIFSFALIPIGSYLNVFNVGAAWQSINTSAPIILLIVALEIFSLRFTDLGIIDFFVHILLRAVKSPFVIQWAIIVITFLLSAMMNNLATILIMVPLSMRIGRRLKFNLKTLVILLVIASNLGGASTAIGDFPNIAISRMTGIRFVTFFLYLGVFIFLVLMPVTLFAFHLFHLARSQKNSDAHPQKFSFLILKKIYDNMRPVPALGESVIVTVLFAVMLGVFVREPFDPSIIAVLFSVVLLLQMRKPHEVLNKIDFAVLCLFVSLFLFAGALKSTGLFDFLSVYFSQHSYAPIIQLLFLLWSSAIVTGLVSAGPTTLLLIPFAQSLSPFLPPNTAWWALSLGVLAGSSATLIGATAGPVAMSLYESSCAKQMSFTDFLKWGVPLALMFLLLSSVYLWVLVKP